MEDFDWSTYIEKTNAVAVPEELFAHVESSLFNGIKKGMLLEVCHKTNPDIYWIAEINMVCGHLLRIKFIGADSDFWCDISTTKVHPLGWCGRDDELIEPPDSINEKYGDTIIEIMKNALIDGISISIDALNNKGLSPIDRIKPSMKIEVQNSLDPFRYWIATVLDNIGGRLTLQYDGSDGDLDKFWIFYTSPRLCSFGYVTNKGSPWQFKYPGKVNKFSCKNKLSAHLRLCAEESIKDPTPSDLFQPPIKTEIHNFITGMKLEALDPITLKTIRPATVLKVFNSFNFLVVLDDHLNDYEDTKMAWLCDLVHPYIFPIGWSEKHSVAFMEPKIWDSGNFDWDEYLTMTSSVPVPEYCFGIKEPIEGFEVNMKLEVSYPLDSDDIYAASIDTIKEHMMYVELLSNGDKVWLSQNSDQIFPVGWCDSNNHELLVPNNKSSEPKAVDVKEVKKVTEEWCEKIYFNYKCYAGPMISKNKISQLPKHVGPGPISLVLKEVLNMLISSSYKPAKLLKDWESEMTNETGMRLEMLKAKLKTNTYHAYIPISSTLVQVPDFCRNVCSHLQACPYLFGLQEFPDQCPERCQIVDKSKFQNGNGDRKGKSKGNGRKRRRKGIRKEKQNTQETESNKDEVDANESGNESENSLPSTPQQSEQGTRPNSPDSLTDYKRPQRKKREPKSDYPKLEMKTRGAKLPNFARQIKEGHWDKKDLETIYSNTCVLPKKKSTDSDSENDSSRSSTGCKNNDISDVSDSEEPELKKLKFNSSHEPQPSDNKLFEKNTRPYAKINPISMKLTSNPLHWTVNDVHSYLSSTEDCKLIADRLRDEEIDGAAFIMLNLPMIEEFLHMKTEYALQLCKHITMIKWYYIVNFEEVTN